MWDHCHAHGIIRGPVCAGCNGQMKDRDAYPWRNSSTAPQEAFRLRCPDCQPVTTVASWVQDGRARSYLRTHLGALGWPMECTRCAIIQFGLGVNPAPVRSRRKTGLHPSKVNPSDRPTAADRREHQAWAQLRARSEGNEKWLERFGRLKPPTVPYPGLNKHSHG